MEQSRNEAILKSILTGEEYKHLPQSRIEALLIDVGELIKGGGASPEQIKYAIDQYLEKHPLEERDPVAMEEIFSIKQDIAKQEERISDLEENRTSDDVEERLGMVVVKTEKQPDTPDNPSDEPVQIINFNDVVLQQVSTTVRWNVYTTRIPFDKNGDYFINPATALFGFIGKLFAYDKNDNLLKNADGSDQSGFTWKEKSRLILINGNTIENRLLSDDRLLSTNSFNGNVSYLAKYNTTPYFTFLQTTISDLGKVGITYGQASETYVEYGEIVPPSQDNPAEYVYEYSKEMAEFVFQYMKSNGGTGISDSDLVNLLNQNGYKDFDETKTVLKNSPLANEYNDASVEYNKLDIVKKTNNLLDPRMVDWEKTPYVTLKDGKYIDVEGGKDLVINRNKFTISFFDENHTKISQASSVGSYTTVHVPDAAKYINISKLATALVDDDRRITIYYANDGVDNPVDDQRKYEPSHKIDGEYIDDSLYDHSVPKNSHSDFMNAVKYEMAREIRKSTNTIRVGTFNIFVSRNPTNWYAVKQVLADNLIDICGFQEVNYKDADGGRHISDFMKSKQFPYGSHTRFTERANGESVMIGKQVVSHWEVISEEPILYDFHPAQNAIKTVIKLEPYKHYMDDINQFTLSVYSYHGASTTYTWEDGTRTPASDLRIMEINHLLSLIESDDSDFIIVCGDTNSFNATMSDDGKHAEWELWKNNGFSTVHNGYTSTVTAGANMRECTDGKVYSTESLDQIFFSEGITCKYYDIVQSNDYPLKEYNGVGVSDHDFLYADLEFDFEGVMQKKMKKKLTTV